MKKKSRYGVSHDLIGSVLSMYNPIVVPYEDNSANLILSYFIELGLAVLIFLAIYGAFLRKAGSRRRVLVGSVFVFVLVFWAVWFVLNWYVYHWGYLYY